MFDMFAYCYKLITVKVSNFDTSKVTNMQGMSYRYHKLKYLDLSSFDTSSSNNLVLLLGGDNSLVYIKFNSLRFKENANFNSMFSSVSPNLKICIEDEDTKNKLQTINIIFNCTDKCFYNDIKIDWESDSCIENWSESGNKYEHNNFCYDICPNTTFSSRNNEYLCLDKSSEGIFLIVLRIYTKNIIIPVKNAMNEVINK